ncbi:hypothetical protein HYS31_03820 [Candidatus Woesearchaeota archaeon]|nr:hypothetical protein [Candidatus Woesearchaeota archaeon]
MLEFLKKIFKDEEQEAKKFLEIKLPILEDWLKEMSKPITEELRLQTEEMLMKISEELQRARFNIEILENAKLQNPNIPFKAKQYMEGNRKAYARAVTSFLGHMEINNKDYFYLIEFCKQFDELINELNKSTLRSYTILQEFFANETNKIAENLRNFDKIFKELKAILNGRKIVAVNVLIEKAHILEAKNKQKINLDVELKDADARAELAVGEKDAILSEIENFNKGDAYSSFLRLNEEKKRMESSFAEDKNKILQAFSVLERPLRKYSHIAFEHEEIVLEYLKNPIESLANDKGYAILQVLANLEKLLAESKIGLDERKKEKSLEEIKRLSKEFLEQFMKKYYSFKAENEELESKIKATGVAEQLKEFKQRLEESNFRIEKNSEELKKLGNDLDKLNNSIESIRSEIESSVKEVFEYEIKVVV